MIIASLLLATATPGIPEQVESYISVCKNTILITAATNEQSGDMYTKKVFKENNMTPNQIRDFWIICYAFASGGEFATSLTR